ncbi:MAG TPA: DUF2232 domain-containing protein [Acidobacteria bacterium]|nr:DUF2232 domain-containing protein [Acidobacteriota bacterium]
MVTAESTEPAPSPSGQGPIRVPTLGVWASGLASLLLYGSLFVLPVLGFFVAPMAVIPLLQRAGRTGSALQSWLWIVLVLAAASAVNGSRMGLLFVAGYLLMVALPVSSVELWERRGWSEGRWAALAVLAGLVVVLAAIAGAAWPVGPVEATVRWITEASKDAMKLYASAGVSQGQMQLALDASLPTMKWLAPQLPVAYMVAVLFWIRPRAPLFGLAVSPGPFEAYRSEEWLPAAFAMGGLGTLLLHGTARWIAVNVLGAVLILYFVHGLAIIRAHLARWVGRGWFVRWGVALLCLQFPMPVLVAGLGLWDSFFDLRPSRPSDHGRTT